MADETGPGFTYLPDDDPAMEAAVRKARATLPLFWQALAGPLSGDSDFVVKLEYRTHPVDSIECLWAIDVSRSGDMVTATIDNDPRDVPDLTAGERVTVPIARIADWMFTRDGLLQGAYTLRALLAYMPQEQADELRAVLAPE
jgi:uncharacterized protein YegJ (DUF2314 family)